MRGLERGNPFKLTPATVSQFVGRDDILQAWEERLTPGSEAWAKGQSWLVIGKGGVGKTSLLNTMRQSAGDVGAYVPKMLDLGRFRELDREEDFLYFLKDWLPPAQKASSRIRTWFGLDPNASSDKLAAEMFKLAANFAVSFAPGDWGGLGLVPDLKRESEPVAAFVPRLAQAFESLAYLSEEQEDRPVVLLVDQVGKAHDSHVWRLVAYQLLQLAIRAWQAECSNVAFVFSMRPERKGMLEDDIHYYTGDDLFRSEAFVPMRLHPLREQEAKDLVVKRTTGVIGWNREFVGKITRVLGESGDQSIEPYEVVLAGAAAWEYLANQSELQLSDLEDSQVREIVRNRHDALLQRVRNPTQRNILLLLASYPSGLTLEEITKQLNRRSLNLSMAEVVQAVMELGGKEGVRLLNASDGPEPKRYALSHDNLREYLLREMPVEERELERARRVLREGTERYVARLSQAPFSEHELELLWVHRRLVALVDDSWEAIVGSALELDPTWIAKLISEYPEEVRRATAKLEYPAGELRKRRRQLLTLGLILNDVSGKRELFRELALGNSNGELRLWAAAALGKLGEADVAVTVLRELMEWTESFIFRHEMVADVLGWLGEPAVEALSEIALSAEDEGVRLAAAQALGRLGSNEVAQQVLWELAQKPYSTLERALAARALEQFGQTKAAAEFLLRFALQADDENMIGFAASFLFDLQVSTFTIRALHVLVNQTNVDVVRKKAALRLAELGEPASEAMVQLARKSDDELVRGITATALGRLGQRELAIEVLRKLAVEGESGSVRWRAAEVVDELGEREDHAFALEILAKVSRDLRWKASVRQGAAEALSRVGDVEAAVEVLGELALQASAPDEFTARRSAIDALVEIGLPARAVLKSLALQASDEGVRIRAAKALGGLGDSELAIAVLRDLAHQGQEEEFRLTAAKALCELQDLKVARDVLNEIAQNGQEAIVRAKSAEVLGGLGEVKLAVEVFYELAQRESRFDSAQETAISGLSAIGEPAVDALIDLTRQLHLGNAALLAAEALGKIGKADLALEALARLVRQAPDQTTYRAARNAIVDLGNGVESDLLGYVWVAAGDSSDEVYASLLLSLAEIEGLFVRTL